MDERFGASRALKALWFCHEFFISPHIPALNFDRGLLLSVTSKTRTPNGRLRGVYVFSENPSHVYNKTHTCSRHSQSKKMEK